MLVHLSVRNFALVRSLDLEFTPGLTAITGESGAGKSILLQALSLVLGARARKEQMRPGEQQCEVTAEFDLRQSPASRAFLEDQELVDPENFQNCLVRRIASQDGRSRAWINGTQVNLDFLRTLCRPLIGIHGQFEERELLDPKVQLAWFDDFGTDAKLLAEVNDAYQTWQHAKSELRRTTDSLGSSLAQHDLLRYQVDELDELDLQEHEFEQLNQQRKRSLKSQEIQTGVHESLELLDNQIRDQLASVARTTDSIDDEHPLLSEVIALLEAANIQIDESVRSLQKYSESVVTDENEQASIEQRLDLIHDTARKHHVQAAELFEHARKLRNDLETVNKSKKLIVQLEQNIVESEKNFRALAQRLRKQRKKLKPKFSQAIENALSRVAITDAKFDVDFSTDVDATGIDSVEYCVSTNANYDPMPMGRIASGGELSRIALALLVVIAKRSQLPCLILDEADVGFGGVTADVVGRMLRSLAGKNQVICVTHAPQVAALADSHIHVYKSEGDDINVRALKDDIRVEEIARMVGGRSVDNESRRYARTLLAGAES